VLVRTAAVGAEQIVAEAEQRTVVVVEQRTVSGSLQVAEEQTVAVPAVQHFVGQEFAETDEVSVVRCWTAEAVV